MTTQEVKDGLFREFQKWMIGQTYGINEDGSENWYDTDYRRFIGTIGKHKKYD